MEDIFFWTRHGKWGFLSNFYRSPIWLDYSTYPTVEHWYQANKTAIAKEHAMIRSLPTPNDARFAGQHVTLRGGWEDMKEGIMLEGLRAKFNQHPDLQAKLLATGDAAIHENSPWDVYWGYKGKDRLGKLLMQVRKERSKEVKNNA